VLANRIPEQANPSKTHVVTIRQFEAIILK